MPLISQVIEAQDSHSGFDILYVGPLKALITDQSKRLADICRNTELSVVPWHGDVSASIKSRAIKNPKGILLITPESLEALFIRRGLEIPRLFSATRAIVIDELHSVLDSERGVQLRSLLARLETTLKRPIRRIGLSATLGDIDLARNYLRPGYFDEVEVIEHSGDDAELKLQLRGYTLGDTDDDAPSATDAVAQHVFEHLRGADNLVFAGSRQSVEIYADRLRVMCEVARLPQEFYPHHASLSREHREFVETRLKDGAKPTTAICTSTLELGIDIGDVNCVAQIGAPFSVASLRQRLGRSGRREGHPAILRQYAVEAKISAESNFADRLRLGLIRAVAMIDLLLEGWCEPPLPDALHLSTLVHQILSVIATRGGASAASIYRQLCVEGPFRQITSSVFTAVLRTIGSHDRQLIEQAGDGLLLLGAGGERLVEHYSFYAVFQTPEEFRLISDGKELGTIPIDNILAPGMLVIFSGRRWLVKEVHDLDRVIVVAPAKAGVPPVFGGDPGIIHDAVVDRMFGVLEEHGKPIYADEQALELLNDARLNFTRLRFDGKRISRTGYGSCLLATRAGTIKNTTLALVLRGQGFRVQVYDGFLEVLGIDDFEEILEFLSSVAEGQVVDVFTAEPNLLFEKFHPYLSNELLKLDALSSRLDVGALPKLCGEIIG